MKNNIKKFVQLWDGIWSIPLALALFVGLQIIGDTFFGAGFGFYDPSIFQAAVMASAMVVIFNMATWLGIYMNFRGIYNFYRYKSSLHFENLNSWQKLSFLALLYAFYLLISVLIFIKLV